MRKGGSSYDAAADRARADLRNYLAVKGMSANALARSAGVGQPTLSRFLSGVTRKVTPEVRRALSYAGIDHNKCIAPSQNAVDNGVLRAALSQVWDGTDEGAELIAQFLEAIGPLLLRRARAPTEKGS